MNGRENDRSVVTAPPAPLSAREDARVVAALEEYLAALEAGRRLDRHEFLACHAAIAGELAEYLDSLEFVQLAAPQLHPCVSPSSPPSSAGFEQSRSRRLGDFRILREIGRGGMGVVYEAEQLSLGRRVALKVLPLAAMMDPRHLQRFHNEARAAAALHHTNIVPVYAVGSERGVHYYAMQFIDGRTLASVIEELQRSSRRSQPTPKIEEDIEEASTTPHIPAEEAPAAPSAETAGAPAAVISTLTIQKGIEFLRTAIRFGVQAAEALDHAHQLGVVHRDIKPANLLVDEGGNVWITDFGLAQMPSDTRLTLTGDLVGTLRYMSPEQALAKRAVIDHRTDIYSLGVTLYELLTLRPAIDGESREEILQKIAFEEPAPPRRHNTAIAVELETIVLKATAKNPAERYATAQELADDLRCFLEDRPIRARRPPLRTRLARWGRRHKPLVAAVLAALLMGLTVLAASIGWVARERAERRAKNQAVISAALTESAIWQEEHRLLEALSAVRRANELLTGADVGESFRQRVQARLADLELVADLESILLERMTEIIKDGHFDAKGTDAHFGQTFRKAGLDVEALPAEEAGERVRNSTVAAELTSVLDKWARIRRGIRGPQDPTWKALLYVAQLADPDAERSRVRKVLAEGDRQALREVDTSEEALRLPAALLSFLGSVLEEDKQARGQAETLLREAQRRHPDDFWVNEDLFWFYQMVQPSPHEDAIRFATAAVALRPQSPGAHNNLGNALRSKGRLDEAIAEYQEAIRINKDLAGVHDNLGLALMGKGRMDEAIEAFREAVRLQKNFAQAHRNLGIALKAKGELDEAIAEYRTALRLKKDYIEAHYALGNALHEKGRLDEAIAEYRDAIRLKNDFAEVHSNLGNVLRDKGRLDESIAEYQEAIRIKSDFAVAHHNLGSSLAVQGKLDEAIAEYREALRLNKDYAHAHCHLGLALKQKGQFQQAVDALRRGHELGSQNPHWSCPSAKWLRDAERLAELDSRLPALLKGEAQPADTVERLALARICQLHKKLYAASARWYAEAFAAQPNLADDLASGNRYNAACAAALAGCKQSQDAANLDDEQRARLRRQALDWLRADVQAWQRLPAKDPEKAHRILPKLLRHWQDDADLAGVRGSEALAKLPPAERTEWQRFWQEVEALRQRAAASPPTTAPSRTNDGSQQGQPGR